MVERESANEFGGVTKACWCSRTPSRTAVLTRLWFHCFRWPASLRFT